MGFNQFFESQKYSNSRPENGLLEEVIFPVDAFPESIQIIIHEASKSLNTEASHLGTGILSAVSLSIGNTLRVQLGPHDKPLPVSTWMMLVESSGGGKGRAQDFGFHPIEEIAELRRVEVSNKKAQLKKSIQDTKQDISVADKDHAKSLKASLFALESELEKLEDFFITTTDITMEAVRSANLRNRRGIGIVRPEISGWYNSFGKYSKTGASSSEESFYIETYDGSPILPFRAGSKGTTCDFPFTNVFGGTQPGTLMDLGKNNRMISGFVFRILFSYPNEKPLPLKNMEQFQLGIEVDQVKKQYSQFIKKIFGDLEMTFKDELQLIPDPRTISFSESALKKYVKWHNSQVNFANGLQIDPQTRNVIKSIVTRSDMSMIRLCLILEVMKWACGESSLESIHPDTILRCAKLMEYYRYTMLKVYGEVEKIKFEQGTHQRTGKSIPYHKVFNGRKELKRDEMKSRIAKAVQISELTAEKYMNDDSKLPNPPFFKSKRGREVVYTLKPNDFLKS